MSNRMGKTDQKTIMSIIFTIDGPSHSETETIACENKWNIVKGMAITLPEFVGPDDKGMIKHGSFLSRLRSGLQFFQEVCEFLGKPSIDTYEFVISIFIFIRFMGKGVMGIINVQPVHLGLPDRFGVLERGYPCEIIYKGIDQHVYL